MRSSRLSVRGKRNFLENLASMRESRQKRGYDKKWERLRAAFLILHPGCSVPGCRARATDVDHIQSVKNAPNRRLDPSNLQSFCHSHHSILTQAYDRGTIRGACDADGNPVDPGHPWAQEDNASAIVAANAEQRADPAVVARLKRAAAIGAAPRLERKRSGSAAAPRAPGSGSALAQQPKRGR